MTNAPDRIDYDECGNLDDIVVNDVTMFRMEWMDNNQVWIKCYREGKPDVAFRLSARGKITGRHDFE